MEKYAISYGEYRNSSCFSSLAVFSPSRRTASSLASDWQSETVGLIVIINRTGREYLMRLKRALDGVRVFDDFVKCPSLPPFFVWKAFVQRADGRGGRFFYPPITLPFPLPYHHATL